MDICIALTPCFLGDAGLPLWIPGTLNDNGTVSLRDTPPLALWCDDDGQQRTARIGDVLSLQPQGNWRARPAGTAGPYELCTRHPTVNLLRFQPHDAVYYVPWKEA